MKNPITVYDGYDRYSDPMVLGPRQDYFMCDVSSTKEEAAQLMLDKLLEDYYIYDIIQTKKESIKIENSTAYICFKIYSICVEVDDLLCCVRSSNSYAPVILLESQECWIKLCPEEDYNTELNKAGRGAEEE